MIPKLHCQTRRVHHRLGVVGVDMEDRGLDLFGHIGRIRRKARLLRRRSITELVVDDHVDGAAGTITFHLREIERLGDDTLAGKGRLAVNQHRHHPRAFRIMQIGLFGVNDPLDDRID